MKNIITRYIEKKFIDPKVSVLEKKIKEQGEVINVQQGWLEKGNQTPSFFSGGIFSGKKQEATKRRGIDFKTLRTFADRYDVARACINRRKRQVNKTDWSVVPVDGNRDRSDYIKDIKKVEDFFQSPSGRYSRFKDLTSKIVEDLLVIDGSSIYKEKGQELEKLVVVDATTIKLNVLSDGSTPEPPEEAYEQWIQGAKVAGFTTEEMIYIMLNPRSSSPYGFAPLESLVLGVDGALKAQIYNLNMLTEGNIPEGFYQLPESYTPKQVKEFQQMFDSLSAGNNSIFQSRLKFMPGGKGTGYTAPMKPEDMRFIEYEKWLLGKTCALFDVMPSDIGFTEDVNRATAQVQQEVGNTAGLIPTLSALKDVFDIIIQEDMKMPHLEWHWYSLDKKDELRESEVAERLISIGAISIDEWRQQNDLEPIGVDNIVITGSGPILLLDALKNTGVPKEKTVKIQEKQNEFIELSKWENKATNDIRAGKEFRKFETDVIDNKVKLDIEYKLEKAKTREDVRNIFKKEISVIRKSKIMEEAKNLKREIEATLNDYE